MPSSARPDSHYYETRQFPAVEAARSYRIPPDKLAIPTPDSEVKSNAVVVNGAA